MECGVLTAHEEGGRNLLLGKILPQFQRSGAWSITNSDPGTIIKGERERARWKSAYSRAQSQIKHAVMLTIDLHW